MEYCANGNYVVYRAYWENQEKYQSLSPKVIGISDGDVVRLQSAFNSYGIVSIVTNNGMIDTAKSIGFSVANIIIGIGAINWNNEVDLALSKGVTQFYVDEPIQKSLQNMVLDAAPYIATRGGTLLISESEFGYTPIFGWGNISAMADLAEQAQPHPFVGCHTHFESEIGYSVDPRDQWSYLHDRIPTLFNFAWIKTRQTPEEMELLFGHANNIGLNKIYLYPFGPPPDNTYIGRIDYATDRGWRQGWFKRFQKERQDKWCCPTQTLDANTCDFQSFIYTGNERWI
ncbi:MAG: hypothetical protein HY089_00645 [Ignavibacteriales bacterium]|nr:hypothetical protein [Ignavibacteriales bacterium]